MTGLLLHTLLTLASGPVHAVVDRAQATLEDTITLTVLIDDLRAREPDLPRIPGARVAPRGRFRASQSINGVRVDTVAFRYALSPKRLGTLRIPAIPIRIGTRLHRTEPIEVKVVSGESPGGVRPFFAVAEVQQSKPYRSQQVVYTLQLYGELLNISCNKVEWPNFDQFIVEDIGQERRFETVRGGRRFRVLELRKALYPLEPGTITLPPAKLTCTVTYPSTRGVLPGGFDQLFSDQRTETKILETEPITLEVRPLPTPPPDFSNIVGRVELNTHVSERRLMAGSSATQTIYIQSDGNLRGFIPPRPELEGVKIYDDQAEVRVNDRGNRLESMLQMNRAFVPVQAGTLTIPPIRFSYFDPESGRYEQASASGFELQVTPNPDAESLRLVDGTGAQDKKDVAVSDETLMPYAATPTLGVRSPPIWVVMLAALFPPLALLAAWVRRRRSAEGSRAPLRRVLEPLCASAPHDAEVIERVVRQVLARGGDRFRAVTAAEVETRLEAYGVEPADRSATAAWLRWAEASRFGGTSDAPPASQKDLLELLSRVDRRLEAKPA